MTRLFLAVSLAVSLLAVVPGASVGCCCCDDDSADNADDGTLPVSSSLPALELRDDTPSIQITWLDEKGDHHVVSHPPEVPESARELVRVVTIEHGHGDLLYVADLRTKDSTGAYNVRTMPRSMWDLIAQQRRQKSIAVPPTSSTTPPVPTTTNVAPPTARLEAIVYSTSWCNVCRNAEAYLRSKGAAVTVKDIEKSQKARTEMNQKLRKAGLPQDGSVPVVDIRGRILKGFSKPDIDRAIRDSTRGDVL